ncbi:MAG: hypothetical protein ACKVQR_23265 [Aquabacterium sp.]
MTGVTSPVERLARSREQLRLAMSSHGAGETPKAGTGPDGPHNGAWTWMSALPAAGIVIDGVQDWWSRHPLNATAHLALVAVRGLVQPLAQRHPWALVLGAAVAGALLVRSRPWRWLLKPALLGGLAQQLLVSTLNAQARSGGAGDPGSRARRP